MPERDDDLDLLIDSALRDYAQPRAGLEQRMFARVSGHVTRSSWRRWVFAAIAAPAVATLILLSYLVPKTPHSQPGQMAYTPATPAMAPVITVPAPRAVARSRSSRHIQHIDKIANRASNSAFSRPKLDVFPTPQPPTHEERALARFVTQAPEADRKALVEAQQRIDQPLNITAIRISPLQLPEVNQN